MRLKACLSLMLAVLPLLSLVPASEAELETLPLIRVYSRQSVVRLRPDQSVMSLSTRHSSLDVEIMPPFIQDDRTYIPLRALTAMGLGTVVWNSAGRYADIFFRDARHVETVIRLRPGSRTAAYIAPGNVEVPEEMQQAVIMTDGRAYIAVRDFGHIMGIDVHFQEKQIIAYWQELLFDSRDVPAETTAEEIKITVLCQDVIQHPDLVKWMDGTGTGGLLTETPGADISLNGKRYRHLTAVVPLEMGANRLEIFAEGRPLGCDMTITRGVQSADR